MNKKKLLGTLLVGGLVVSAPLAVFANSGNSTEENMKKNLPILDLTDEEHLEFMKEKTQIKLNHVSSLIDALEEEGIDTTDFDVIVEDYAELVDFLDTIDVNETTKEELKETFFEMKPDREGMKELKEIARDTFDQEELKEIREDFKSDLNELREKYDLPERKKFGKSKNKPMRFN